MPILFDRLSSLSLCLLKMTAKPMHRSWPCLASYSISASQHISLCAENNLAFTVEIYFIQTIILTTNIGNRRKKYAKLFNLKLIPIKKLFQKLISLLSKLKFINEWMNETNYMRNLNYYFSRFCSGFICLRKPSYSMNKQTNEQTDGRKDGHKHFCMHKKNTDDSIFMNE